MANVTQLKHLEHLEDEMLNYGVEGCKAAVSFLQELRKMLGCDDSKGFMQTKRVINPPSSSVYPVLLIIHF